jgi:rhamnose utilization protein RhaD (predicted bifunctional aldolase and dehydrogenase)
MTTVESSVDLAALNAMSARIGADPLITQAAGGNTSLKDGGTLWIKASGTWLKDALDRDIMVPVALAPLLDAVERNDPDAEQAHLFTLADRNPNGLRPSIETTVHGLMPQRVVIHVHCVSTLALALRTDAEARIGALLSDLAWAFVPYCRPGLPLARAIAAAMRPGVDVLVLGNHGLAVAADTVEAAEALLYRAIGMLDQPVRRATAADIAWLADGAVGSGYRLPLHAESHAAATDDIACRIAAAGSFYPDHVIFLGSGSAIATPGESVSAAIGRLSRERGAPPVEILFPGKGVLMREDANAGAEALARCLSDVLLRVPADTPLHPLTAEQNDELSNWDAEKYRQKLTREREAAERSSAR